MNDRIICINPNLVLQKHDIFTTGIVYMPFGLATFAGTVRSKGYLCEVVDCFGENPTQFWEDDAFLYRGIQPFELIQKIEKDGENTPTAIFIYAINLTYHRSVLLMIGNLRKAFPKVPIIVLEHTQAVTAYSLENVQDEFYEAGATYVVMGEPEERAISLLELIEQSGSPEKLLEVDGIGFRENGKTRYTPAVGKIKDLDALPFPAWDLFPVKNYWNLKYSHGPLSSSRYLPLLTSRGCPYACRFCVIPETNNLKWRARSAKNVVDEIEHWMKTWNVREFHIEDVDPTVNDKRTQEICREIIDRGLKIKWKISSGTKVETLKSEKTIELMAKAGCSYISISPESGSARVMKLINKPFNYDHAVKLIGKMKKVGIHSQACFVLGFPGEKDEDRLQTRKMIYDLTRAGVSEIAQFIVTPVPGSDIYAEYTGYEDYSQLNFSPSWREDYEKLNRFRVKLYREFLIWKLIFHPISILKQPFRFLFRSFETKMEMVPYRALHTLAMIKGFIGSRVRPPERLPAQEFLAKPGKMLETKI